MNEGHLQGSGISHLLEHLVFKGTENYSGQDLARKVQEREAIGMPIRASTAPFSIWTVRQVSWQVFLNLTELVFSPPSGRRAGAGEGSGCAGKWPCAADEPDSVAYQLLMQTLYLKHPRRWPVLGQPAVFDTLTREDVLEYHASRYVPNNVVLSIAGDVDAREVLSTWNCWWRI